MTIYFIEKIVFECDHCGERREEYLAPLEEDEFLKYEMTGDLIKLYRDKGWLITDDLDLVLCPECRKEYEKSIEGLEGLEGLE